MYDGVLWHVVRLGLEDPESSREVVRQRGAVIERRRVQPHARGARGPRLLYRDAEQVLAQAAADEVRQDTEVRDLHGSVVHRAQLEVARGRTRGRHHPQLDRGIAQIAQDVLVRPRQPIDPVVCPSDFGVEIAPERWRPGSDALDADAIERRTRGAQIAPAVHLEVSAPCDRAHEGYCTPRARTRASRQRDALVKTDSIFSPSPSDARSSVIVLISASSASRRTSSFDAAISRQISGGLDARRVVSSSPGPASSRPASPASVPTPGIGALAGIGGGWLTAPRRRSSRKAGWRRGPA